jgi:anaerobic selenocysteine-containing dehydrogenase
MVATELARRESGWEGSPLAGASPEEIVASLGERRGPERLLDLLLRAGPYDLTLADLEAAPHGVDLGPLEPRLPEMLRTPSGRVELAPGPVVDDVPRLRAALDREVNGGMVLIGRRELRSNNSWMHNLPKLAGGPAARRALLVHPDDAARLGLADGEDARVRSRAGSVTAPVSVTDEMMPGVVSLPHGWGHAGDGVRLDVASAEPGSNTNVLTDEQFLDVPSGNAALNGVRVEVEPARVPAAVTAG